MLRKFVGVVALGSLVLVTARPAAAQRDAKSVIAAASKASGYDDLKKIEYVGSGVGEGGVGHPAFDHRGRSRVR